MALGKGTRSLLVTVAVAAAILGSGRLVGRLIASAEEKPAARANGPIHNDGDALPATSGAPHTSARPSISQLARINPITGPGRPPLPAERGAGPFGSRKSTGTADVALTFDDGPDPKWTPRVLEMLRRYHIKATFCVVGVNVDKHPELIRMIVADGHTICNHTYYHDADLGYLEPDQIRDNLKRTNRAIQRAAPGTKISYYRQPGGNWTPAVIEVAKKLGMSSLHWRVDPQDWLVQRSNSIARSVSAGTTTGSIVLLHDGGGDRTATVDAMRSMLPNLVSRFLLSALPPGIDPPRRFGIDRPLHPGQG